MVLRRKNVNPNDYIHCCIIGCHGNSLLHFGLNTRISCEGLLGGGKLFLKHLYLNDNEEFNSKISYIMFLHAYHLALFGLIYGKGPRFTKTIQIKNVKINEDHNVICLVFHLTNESAYREP